MNLVREATDWQRGEQIFCVRRVRFACAWAFLDYNPTEIISTDCIVFLFLYIYYFIVKAVDNKINVFGVLLLFSC